MKKTNGNLRPPWPRGTSGNPGGRPKTEAAFRKRCRSFVDEHVIAAWEKEVREHGEKWLEASKLLAGYGYGPVNAVDVDADGDEAQRAQPLTIEERRALARMQLSNERQEQGDDERADEEDEARPAAGGTQ